jgi:uncharacterized protein with PQ loop repeat
MGKYESFIGIAGILGLVSFSSLVQKIYQTKNTESLPWTWIVTNLGAQILSLLYGIANNAYGIYVPNIFFIAGLLYIFYVKVYEAHYEEKKPPPKQL